VSNKAKGGALLVAVLAIAIAYSEAPKIIAEKIKTEVNSMPLRVRAIIAWRVLLGRLNTLS